MDMNVLEMRNGRQLNDKGQCQWEEWDVLEELKVLYQNEMPTEDKDHTLLIQRGLGFARKPRGIAAVEGSFSPLKMMQTAKRAALSYKKMRKLLYILQLSLFEEFPLSFDVVF